MKRQIPDSECVQSKCARNTTGCWGECEMRRSPAMYGLPTPGVYTVSVASPVQGAASAPSVGTIGHTRIPGMSPIGDLAAASATDQGALDPEAVADCWRLAAGDWRKFAADIQRRSVRAALAERAQAAQLSGAVGEVLRVLLDHVGWTDCTDDELRAYATGDSVLAPAILKARAMLATPAPEQEATPKCPRCKDTRKWTHTDEAGDHGDEYPCMDCGVADAKEAAENLAALLRGLKCRPELAEAGADFLFKLGQAIATQAKKAPDAGAAPQPKGESDAS